MVYSSIEIKLSHKFWQFHRQIFDLSVVELPEVGRKLSVSSSNKVNLYALSSETAWPTNSVDVLGIISWQIVVDDQADLLNIDTSAQQISWNQYSRRHWPELFHHIHSLRHLYISWYARHHKFVLASFSAALSRDLCGWRRPYIDK